MNHVHSVTMLAFWVIVASQAIEFFCGYYEQDLHSCRAAETHYILKDSWYARGCRFGTR